MKIVIINRSDATGGAAVVSRRLMEAFRQRGEDAQMLVCEKLTESPFIHLAASKQLIQRQFLAERLKIFIANGFNRNTLFKIDTGDFGLPLWKHPLVKDADAILINWVSQGMLSLNGFKKILKLGNPVIWTMHDMWNLTGICHHFGSCPHFTRECGNCPLLFKNASPKDLSYKIWTKKNKIYNKSSLNKKLVFVAVSNWVRDCAQESSLLKNQKVEVIGNPFDFQVKNSDTTAFLDGDKIKILFSAARLDDPIKGLDVLKKATHILSEKYPDIKDQVELILAGNTKDPKSLEGFGLPFIKLGLLQGESELRKAYEGIRIIVSASSNETFGCTLQEGQAYGCVPVSFDRGGQSDIIDHLDTGYLAHYVEDPEERAQNLAEGIIYAYKIVTDHDRLKEFQTRMRRSVEEKFSYRSVTDKYLGLIHRIEKM